jgi:hypothetical protein
MREILVFTTWFLLAKTLGRRRTEVLAKTFIFSCIPEADVHHNADGTDHHRRVRRRRLAPRCGGWRRKLIAVITESPVIAAILA